MIYRYRELECDRLKLVIMGHFLPYKPPPPPPAKKKKNQILKKMKKFLEISFYISCVPKTKIIIWGTISEIEWDRQIFLSFWAIFCHFTLLTTQKVTILKKWKNHMKISSFYICVPKITIIWYMLPEIL